MSDYLRKPFEFYRARFSDLKYIIDTVQNSLITSDNASATALKVKDALEHFSNALGFIDEQPEGEKGLERLALRKAVYQSLIQAQVAIDAARFPNIEPLIGWVETTWLDLDMDGEEELIVDTQLQRLYLKPSMGGAILEHDYKPRKVNLTNVLTDEPEGGPLEGEFKSSVGLYPCCSLQDAFGKEEDKELGFSLEPWDYKILRQAPDVLLIRFFRELGMGTDLEFNKLLSIRSGIGAHLKEATTGFTVEYWLEGSSKPEEDVFILSRWHTVVRSEETSAISIYPLLAVSGVGEEKVDLTKEVLTKGEDLPGGLYGLRFVDGVGNLTIDYRFSKPISSLLTKPVYQSTTLQDEEPKIQGISFRFNIQAASIFGDTKTNNLFVSIV